MKEKGTIDEIVKECAGDPQKLHEIFEEIDRDTLSFWLIATAMANFGDDWEEKLDKITEDVIAKMNIEKSDPVEENDNA